MHRTFCSGRVHGHAVVEDLGRFGLGAALSGCGSGGNVYYAGHCGHDPWRHDRYYDRPVAVPLPEPPMDVPDFGMPDMLMGGGLDFGPDF